MPDKDIPKNRNVQPVTQKNDDADQFEDVLDKVKPPLDKNQKDQLEKYLHVIISRSISVSQVRSAPLPHPSEFEQYERILPGSADRILTMAEKQSAHRQEIEKKIVYSETSNQNKGLIFAFILAILAIGGSVFLICIGKDTAGLVGIIGTLASLVGVFIFGKTRQNKQLNEKNKSLKE